MENPGLAEFSSEEPDMFELCLTTRVLLTVVVLIAAAKHFQLAVDHVQKSYDEFGGCPPRCVRRAVRWALALSSCRERDDELTRACMSGDENAVRRLVSHVASTNTEPLSSAKRRGPHSGPHTLQCLLEPCESFESAALFFPEPILRLLVTKLGLLDPTRVLARAVVENTSSWSRSWWSYAWCSSQRPQAEHRSLGLLDDLALLSERDRVDLGHFEDHTAALWDPPAPRNIADLTQAFRVSRVRLLLELGADPANGVELLESGGVVSSPLQLCRNPAVLRVLLTAVRETSASPPRSSLHGEKVACLVSALPASENSPVNRLVGGRTSLHDVVHETTLRRILLEFGADPRIRDTQGDTPIDVARRRARWTVRWALELPILIWLAIFWKAALLRMDGQVPGKVDLCIFVSCNFWLYSTGMGGGWQALWDVRAPTELRAWTHLLTRSEKVRDQTDLSRARSELAKSTKEATRAKSDLAKARKEHSQALERERRATTSLRKELGTKAKRLNEVTKALGKNTESLKKERDRAKEATKRAHDLEARLRTARKSENELTTVLAIAKSQITKLTTKDKKKTAKYHHHGDETLKGEETKETTGEWAEALAEKAAFERQILALEEGSDKLRARVRALQQKVKDRDAELKKQKAPPVSPSRKKPDQTLVAENVALRIDLKKIRARAKELAEQKTEIIKGRAALEAKLKEKESELKKHRATYSRVAQATKAPPPPAPKKTEPAPPDPALVSENVALRLEMSRVRKKMKALAQNTESAEHERDKFGHRVEYLENMLGHNIPGSPRSHAESSVTASTSAAGAWSPWHQHTKDPEWHIQQLRSDKAKLETELWEAHRRDTDRSREMRDLELRVSDRDHRISCLNTQLVNTQKRLQAKASTPLSQLKALNNNNNSNNNSPPSPLLAYPPVRADRQLKALRVPATPPSTTRASSGNRWPHTPPPGYPQTSGSSMAGTPPSRHRQEKCTFSSKKIGNASWASATFFELPKLRLGLGHSQEDSKCATPATSGCTSGGPATTSIAEVSRRNNRRENPPENPPDRDADNPPDEDCVNDQGLRLVDPDLLADSNADVLVSPRGDTSGSDGILRRAPEYTAQFHGLPMTGLGSIW